MKDFCTEILRKHIGSAGIDQIQRVGGGCINETVKIHRGSDVYFLKWNAKEARDMFEKEAFGLNLLDQNSHFRIPGIFGKGTKGDKSYLLLEWMDSGVTSDSFWKSFGHKLGDLHKTSSGTFGLDHDNYIGKLPQSNQQHKTWADFFILERIEPQLRLAKKNGFLDSTLQKSFHAFFSKLDLLIPTEAPSLLHGDLWSGNFLCGDLLDPILIDPAVHFGHRETELAFTTLFGGFDQVFYHTYNEVFPLKPGFEERIGIHNLYPLLVHVNLFGSSYLPGIRQTIKRFS